MAQQRVIFMAKMNLQLCKKSAILDNNWKCVCDTGYSQSKRVKASRSHLDLLLLGDGDLNKQKRTKE